MNFDPNLPLNIRISRRRKYRRKKRIAVLTVLMLVMAVISVICFRKDSFTNIAEGTGWDFFGLKGAAMQAEAEDVENGKNPAENAENKEKNAGGGEENNGTGKNLPEETPAETAKPDEIKGGMRSGTEAGPSGKVGGGRGAVAKKDVNILKNELEEYIKGFKGQYGIYYMQIEDGGAFGINDTDEYIAASTVKIPLNLYLYNKIKDGSVDPKSVMTYLEKDYEGGTGNIQYRKVGSSYTVKELAKLSIEVSDNIAANMLLRLLGRKNLKDYMRSLGGIVVDDARNVSCPRDMALYMKKIYEFCEENKELGSELIGYFKNTVFNDRIPKLLPAGVEIAHKIGNQVGALHDVGIVFIDEPYIISIMSKNVNETEAYDAIANMSKKAYDFASE